jgi:hypothetical protein
MRTIEKKLKKEMADERPSWIFILYLPPNLSDLFPFLKKLDVKEKEQISM